MAKWGMPVGSLWGIKDNPDNVRITDLVQDPPAILITWDAVGTGNLYHVFLNGVFLECTANTNLRAVVEDEGRHFVEVFVVGPGGCDQDISQFISSIPGGKAKLTWTKSSSNDVKNYRIMWDQGLGTINTLLAETAADTGEYISPELDNGTYKFRVDAVDFAGNIRISTSTVTIVISKYPIAPTNLTLISYDSVTDIAAFSFTESVTSGVTETRVYSNGGSGEIDYSSSVQTVTAGNSTFNLTLSTARSYKIGIRAFDGSNEEDNVDIYVEFEISGANPVLLDPQPNVPEAFSVSPTAAGAMIFRCNYEADEELAKATKVNFYKNDGAGGAIDFSTVFTTAAVEDHDLADSVQIPIEVTSTSLTDAATYKFAAKSATSGDRESDATEEIEATADATAPADITGLTGVAANG